MKKVASKAAFFFVDALVAGMVYADAMSELVQGKRRSKKAGLPPGSLVYIGPDRSAPPRITVMQYNAGFLAEAEIKSLSELDGLQYPDVVTWINVDATHDSKLLAEFGERFKLHPLMMEDILNTEHRPKCDYSDGLVFIFAKLLDYVPASQTIMTEQVSMVLGENWLITFQEEIGNECDNIRARLRKGTRGMRSSGADYLAYSILDMIIDRYFLVLENMGEELERLEYRLENPHLLTTGFLHDIHTLRRELIFMRKTVWPMREVVNTLLHLDVPLVSETTQMYLRDVYDHTIQIMDTLETNRDLLSSTQDLYLSVLSNRMNEIMKVLTIMSTVFIPLTFVVGVYGMNFKYMPELNQHWGYPAVWGLMVVIVIAMVLYFKHKGWIWSEKDPPAASHPSPASETVAATEPAAAPSVTPTS